MTIADRIKKRRLELSLSQEDLAKRLGYKDKSSISKIENSGDDISLKKIKKQSDALIMDLNELLGIEPDPEIKEFMTKKTKYHLDSLAKRKMMEYIRENITDFELDIIDAYRDASIDTQKAICAILNLQKED